MYCPRFARNGFAVFAALFIGFTPKPTLALEAPSGRTPALDVDYVPTPMPTVRRMLEMADVGPDDHLVDLGSGDGRILVTATRDHDVRTATGVELDPWLVEFAARQAAEAGVADRIEFIQGDLFETDFAHADVVTMYLLPQLNLQLRPYLLSELSPGTRIVSNSFDMGEWQPDKQDELFTKPIYLWVVPAQVEGRWHVRLNQDEPPIELTLEQDFQHLEGRALHDNAALDVHDLELNGRDIRFRLGNDLFEGHIEGHRIQSTGALQWSATREH